MKKGIILLPLAFVLASCSLNLGDSFGGGNNGDRSRAQLDPNDVALKILNAITVFPEVNDEINFDDYVDFDPGFDHTLSEYTFVSSNPSVISINGYHAKCEKEGFTVVSISGPGINQPTELSFYVGSISGKYVPDNKRIKDLVSFTIGDMEAETRVCDFSLEIKEGEFRRNQPLRNYQGQGTYVKNGSPFLMLDFEADAPKYFSPITDYLSLFGIDADLTEYGIQTNVYGLLSYDEDYGVCIRTIFYGEEVDFYVD